MRSVSLVLAFVCAVGAFAEEKKADPKVAPVLIKIEGKDGKTLPYPVVAKTDDGYYQVFIEQKKDPKDARPYFADEDGKSVPVATKDKQHELFYVVKTAKGEEFKPLPKGQKSADGTTKLTSNIKTNKHETVLVGYFGGEVYGNPFNYGYYGGVYAPAYQGCNYPIYNYGCTGYGNFCGGISYTSVTTYYVPPVRTCCYFPAVYYIDPCCYGAW